MYTCRYYTANKKYTVLLTRNMGSKTYSSEITDNFYTLYNRTFTPHNNKTTTEILLKLCARFIILLLSSTDAAELILKIICENIQNADKKCIFLHKCCL